MFRFIALCCALTAVMASQMPVQAAPGNQKPAKTAPSPSKSPYYPTIYIYQPAHSGLRLDNGGSAAQSEASETARTQASGAPAQEKNTAAPAGDTSP